MNQKRFEQHIKAKMEGYAPKDCPDIWANIEASLDAEKPSKRIVPWWIVSVAASLIVIVTAGLLMYNFDKNDVKLASLPIENDTIRRIVDTQIRPELTSDEAIPSVAALYPSTISSPSKARVPMNSSLAMKMSVPLLQSMEESTQQKDVAVDEKKAIEQGDAVQTRSTKTTVTTQNSKQAPFALRKNKEKPLLFSLATNNSIVSISKRNNAVAPLYKSANRRLMGLMQLANADVLPRTELQHYQPITVSLTARKRLSERFSLEAGLAYSYLYSKTKTDIGVQRFESQELHYIGIPVSGIVDLFKGKQWSIYAKAGGQIEMNVSGKWNEKWSEEGREFANSDVTDLEKKPQFSAHLALGFGYKLTKSVQLSLEPGANYYFDNKSEVDNIYKQRPLSGSINVALSYLF